MSHGKISVPADFLGEAAGLNHLAIGGHSSEGQLDPFSPLWLQLPGKSLYIRYLRNVRLSFWIKRKKVC